MPDLRSHSAECGPDFDEIKNARNSDHAKAQTEANPDIHFGGQSEEGPGAQKEEGPGQSFCDRFPIDALIDPLGAMAEAMSESLNIPIELTGPAVLAATSGSLGKGIRISSGADLYVFGNLFLLGFAPSGEGKSKTFRPAMAPIYAAAQNTQEFWRQETEPALKREKMVLGKTDQHSGQYSG